MSKFQHHHQNRESCQKKVENKSFSSLSMVTNSMVLSPADARMRAPDTFNERNEIMVLHETIACQRCSFTGRCRVAPGKIIMFVSDHYLLMRPLFFCTTGPVVKQDGH